MVAAGRGRRYEGPRQPMGTALERKLQASLIALLLLLRICAQFAAGDHCVA